MKTHRPASKSTVPRSADAERLRSLDRAFVWHPFTQMQDWCDPGFKPIVIAGGKGAVLRDADGREYLDGNSSIWTNIHGHRHPHIDTAISAQLKRIAHSSFLGLTNDVAPRLAERLVKLMNAPAKGYRVFFSDDGSTAIEAALKMAVQARLQRGELRRKRFVRLSGAYHGDTVGAMSLGFSPHFHRPFEHLRFETVTVPAPSCSSCARNRSRGRRRHEGRQTRVCGSQCVPALERLLDRAPDTICALFAEPLVQGAAGMRMQPPGFLAAAAEACRRRGIWLILDEVMTGFGRTGAMFACQKERVQPDLMALGKGLTGGYLPLAATLASREIYDAFLGEYRDCKTFFHGHSYTGNALGCAAALANLEVFENEQVLARLKDKARWLKEATARFWDHPNVGDVRQEGMICAIELFQAAPTKPGPGAIARPPVARRNRQLQPFAAADRIGARVCRAAEARGLLTRPIGDVLVLMPPFCVTREQVESMAYALWKGLCEVLPVPAKEM